MDCIIVVVVVLYSFVLFCRLVLSCLDLFSSSSARVPERDVIDVHGLLAISLSAIHPLISTDQQF